MSVEIIGIDLGKSTFHLVGRDSHGDYTLKKKLSRLRLQQFLVQLPPCRIAFEACGGAHWLGRFCEQQGHEAVLIPPQYVKPFVKGNKNDFIDALAIIEASARPQMPVVPVKTLDQQARLLVHRVRDGYVADRTACMSRIGSLLLEFGLSLPAGHAVMKHLFGWLAKQSVTLSPLVISELQSLHDHYLHLNERIRIQDDKIRQHVQENELCQLAQTIPGIGEITASQLVAEVGNARQFKNGRHLAAWLGLVPKQYSTGGKPRLMGISKRGNHRLRCLLVHGARAVLSRLDKGKGPLYDWLRKLRSIKPFNQVCVALANKLARIAQAVLVTQTAYQPN